MNSQTKQTGKTMKFLGIGVIMLMLLLLAAIPAMAAIELNEADFQAGNYVTFGTYPQTVSGTDETPIEWLVLDRNGNRALLLSRCGLDVQPYNKELEYITWENCSLRSWLNDTFINKTFTDKEKLCILLTDVENSRSQSYKPKYVTGGNDTQDKIFLLSYAEANKYLGVESANYDNVTSRMSPTRYAKTQGAFL